MNSSSHLFYLTTNFEAGSVFTKIVPQVEISELMLEIIWNIFWNNVRGQGEKFLMENSDCAVQ